ncbi:MAG: uroporphyrinogen-III synthase [Paracoccaceae bacterium]
MTNNASPISLVLTRPLAKSQAFWDDLPAHLRDAFRLVLAPLITIEPCNVDFALPKDATVIFSSTHGVSFAPDGEGRSAFCVGPATTKAALANNWQAKMMGSTANSLVVALSDIALPDAPLVHLSGRHTRGNIAQRLTAKGTPVRHVVIYEQRGQHLSNEAKSTITGNEPVFIPLFSPRTARQLAIEIDTAPSATIIALSRNVAAEVTDLGVAVQFVADEPNAKAMVTAIESALKST